MARITIHAGRPLIEAIAATGDDDPETGNRAGRVNNIAERYMDIVHFAMPEFTRAEWCAIMDANNGVQITGDLMSLLTAWVNVADSPELVEKWEVDHTRLAQRMQALPRAARIAIGEAIERFWRHHELPTDEALEKAGVKIAGNPVDASET